MSKCKETAGKTERTIKYGHSRDTGNIGLARHRTKTIKYGHSRDTGNIGLARHKTYTHKAKQHRNLKR